VKQYANGYVNNRVLRLNVGFLLADGPGHIHESRFDVPAVRVSDDLDLAFVRGPLRLSRTKEGILVQGQLEIGVEDECYRCLDPVSSTLPIILEELYSYPASNAVEFSIGDDAILDLASLIRAEVMIAVAGGILCGPDCKGLCPECGANLNHGTCECADSKIDPRMAKLQELLNAKK
jgi:uncharacterized metal-binding protein YceD (DUF177 family)